MMDRTSRSAEPTKGWWGYIRDAAPHTNRYLFSIWMYFEWTLRTEPPKIPRWMRPVFHLLEEQHRVQQPATEWTRIKKEKKTKGNTAGELQAQTGMPAFQKLLWPEWVSFLCASTILFFTGRNWQASFRSIYDHFFGTRCYRCGNMVIATSPLLLGMSPNPGVISVQCGIF